jgi:hypothetical protein|tara:strand:- start:202 stop:423 length:222 start_codon:yes stop_codon:yes gene_type:complete
MTEDEIEDFDNNVCSYINMNILSYNIAGMYPSKDEFILECIQGASYLMDTSSEDADVSLYYNAFDKARSRVGC